jgi:two-component sensor histidine kinase
VIVRLSRVGEGRACVEIIRKDGEGGRGAVRSGPEDDLGAQLVTAFAMQLGSVPVQSDDGGDHRLSVEFSVRPASRA